MKSLFAVRIVRDELKLAYVLVFDLVAFGINSGLARLYPPVAVASLVSVVLSLTLFLYGARVFRGRYEEVAPPRPWWRMTATKRLSTLFAALFVLLTFCYAGDLIGWILGIANASNCGCGQTLYLPSGPITATEWLLWAGFLSFMYINSAIRIKRPDILAPEANLKVPRSTSGISR